MQFIKPGINVNFIGKRNIAFVFSGLMILATIVLLMWRGGPNYGVDFSGGVLVQVKMAQKTSPAEIKKALRVVDLDDSIVQEFGEAGQFEYLIRIRKTEVELSTLGDRVEQALNTAFGKNVEIRRVEMVGPKVGKDLRQKALFAIFYSILFIAIYISGRFELKWLMSIIMAICLGFCGLYYLRIRRQRHLAYCHCPHCNAYALFVFESQIRTGCHHCHYTRCGYHHGLFRPH